MAEVAGPPSAAATITRLSDNDERQQVVENGLFKLELRQPDQLGGESGTKHGQ